MIIILTMHARCRSNEQIKLALAKCLEHYDYDYVDNERIKCRKNNQREVAIFAIHAALGDDVEYIDLDQTLMRNHLLQCFRRKALERFPTTRKRSRRNDYFPYHKIDIF